jgi:uncharacterized glyoxalase superfamily protein PhnB
MASIPALGPTQSSAQFISDESLSNRILHAKVQRNGKDLHCSAAFTGRPKQCTEILVKIFMCGG